MVKKYTDEEACEIIFSLPSDSEISDVILFCCSNFKNK